VYQQSDVDGKNMLQEFKQFRDAPTTSPLYQNGMQFQPVGVFEYDARNDKLPTVTWIPPSDVDSEHPNDTPAAGAAYIASKIDAIAANPDVWAKTVFILSYDENDGLFDHVVPPTPPAGTHGSLQLSEYEVSQLPAPTLPGATQTPPRQEPGRRPRA
jgi:phospholipase C